MSSTLKCMNHKCEQKNNCGRYEENPTSTCNNFGNKCNKKNDYQFKTTAKKSLIEKIKNRLFNPLTDISKKLGATQCPKCKTGLINPKTNQCITCGYKKPQNKRQG